MSAAENERRDGSRIDLRLMVHYDAGDEVIESRLDKTGSAEASDLSARGLRLESEKEVPVGVRLKMKLSDGDEESISTTGRVTWCTARKSPTGKTIYDTGVHFVAEWLKNEQGHLATALSKLFSMGEHAVERSSERVKVSINASLNGEAERLTIADLSSGGMFACFFEELEATRGITLKVTFELDESTFVVDGRIAWTADISGDQPGGFGVQFLETSQEEQENLQKIRDGDLSAKTVSVVFD
ncbi:MAG: PilZ domain-containing protein [Deltaproteobacteria bacterium]|nr:PilZ domain-containing protein [Deltaproteobacteria bacterium]